MNISLGVTSLTVNARRSASDNTIVLVSNDAVDAAAGVVIGRKTDRSTARATALATLFGAAHEDAGRVGTVDTRHTVGASFT